MIISKYLFLKIFLIILFKEKIMILFQFVKNKFEKMKENHEIILFYVEFLNF